MKEFLSKMDGIDRRHFLTRTAQATLGVSVLPSLNQAVMAAESKGKGKAKRLIYLFMAGGMTHLDTFDLKPGHANQGATKPISTSVPGCQISNFLPTLAGWFHEMAVIRSMNTQTGDHEAGEYLMRTSYETIATERHPSIGPWMQRFLDETANHCPIPS